MGLYNTAEQQIQATLRNLDAAVEFVVAAENNHPNRIDICKQNTIQGGTTGVFARTSFGDNPLSSNGGANQNPFSAAQANPFAGGGGAAAGGSSGGGGPTFGQPSTLGQKPNPFGAPQFGQPSQMGAAAPSFGQPSQMGAAAPAFGQPSQMGAAAPTFGQPTQMGASAPTFGQPSQMGASGPAFGQPSVPGARPNPFSAPSAAGPSPFARAMQPSFGQPSVIGQPNPFQAPAAPAANPFSQQGPAAPSANPFSQSKDQPMDTSTPGPAPNNPFGPPPSASNGFGAQAQPTAGNAFSGAQPNPFGNPGVAAQTQANPLQNQLSSQTPATAAAVRPGPYAPGSTRQHPPAESYITRAMSGQITAFRGQPVIYKWKVNDRYQDQPPDNPSADQPAPGIRRPDGTWSKILFPAGPPPYNRDTEPDAGQYDANARAAYARMAASGRFQGDMPEAPPMREDCVWTF